MEIMILACIRLYLKRNTALCVCACVYNKLAEFSFVDLSHLKSDEKCIC